MNRLGVYVAAGPNPIFLRMLFLQIARQTKVPECIAVFENGNKSYALEWACKDVLKELRGKGVQILHKHDPLPSNRVKRYGDALRMLYMSSVEVDTFLKMDIDDFYEDTYVENTSNMLGNNDFAINLNCGLVLVRPFHGDFKKKESSTMHHSPVGAAPTHVAFNRTFAEKYLGYLSGAETREDIADDELMAECSKGMRVARVDGPVDYFYVSHGTNESSASWQSTGGRVYFDN